MALFVTACGGANVKPKWTMLPPDDGKVYGVGSSPEHIKGPNFQRALAMSMAIDEIARQNGVKVSNSLDRMQEVDSSGNVRSSARSVSLQTVDGKMINAVIKDMWENRHHKLYVLMVQK